MPMSGPWTVRGNSPVFTVWGELDRKKALKVVDVCPPFRFKPPQIPNELTGFNTSTNKYMQEKHGLNAGWSIRAVMMSAFSFPVCIIQLHIDSTHHTAMTVCALLG